MEPNRVLLPACVYHAGAITLPTTGGAAGGTNRAFCCLWSPRMKLTQTSDGPQGDLAAATRWGSRNPEAVPEHVMAGFGSTAQAPSTDVRLPLSPLT